MFRRSTDRSNNQYPFSQHDDGLDDDFIEEEWQFVPETHDDDEAEDFDSDHKIDWYVDEDEEEDDEDYADEDYENDDDDADDSEFCWGDDDDEDDNEDDDPEYEDNFDLDE
jgi:hypothetical protein